MLIAQAQGLKRLVQARGGLFSSTIRARARSAEPRFVTRIAPMGDLLQLEVIGRKKAGSHPPVSESAGAGTSIEDGEANLLALAEGLERYCAAVYEPDQLIRAPANELGEKALDLAAIPRCSETELLHPDCPLIAPNKTEAIRWVPGLSLHDGKLVYIPACMVYTRAGYISPDERFWRPITTGCAIHCSYEDALLNGLLEVIERDAISIIWLQRLQLPQIVVDDVPACLTDLWGRLKRASCAIEYTFFDATFDLGIPTVYGVQTSRTEEHLTTLVSCATALDPAEALGKVIREMASLRVAFRQPRRPPDDPKNCNDVFDGAAYMARRSNRSGFDFLLTGKRTIRLSEMIRIDRTRAAGLKWVLRRLKECGMEAYAVDLSTDEAIRAGFRAVRAIVPGLQPLSFCHRARYLGHPRLYDTPVQMGYPSYAESDLNPWPQPFA
jgi:ribosomal protein S12 methylthiotransferase accessory factor